jgi:hypothetical protein
MRRILSALTILAVVIFAGCEDSPSDPTGQPIVGSWKSSKVGDAFPGASNVEAEFTSTGSVTMEVGGQTWTGSYTTSGSASSSTVRNIVINVTSPASMSLSGIYTISGSQMKLEVVTVPPPTGVVGPDASLGIGSTTVNGSTTNDFVTEMQKQ